MVKKTKKVDLKERAAALEYWQHEVRQICNKNVSLSEEIIDEAVERRKLLEKYSEFNRIAIQIEEMSSLMYDLYRNQHEVVRKKIFIKEGGRDAELQKELLKQHQDAIVKDKKKIAEIRRKLSAKGVKV